jgi:hypothetical protein
MIEAVPTVSAASGLLVAAWRRLRFMQLAPRKRRSGMPAPGRRWRVQVAESVSCASGLVVAS